MRLREVRSATGVWLATKLGQKIVNPEAIVDARQRKMTTIYLPESEGVVFSKLAGLRTVKRRYKITEQGWTWCVDVWEQPALGTIIAEVETPTLEELESLCKPAWAEYEVTDDPRYSAIRLAETA